MKRKYFLRRRNAKMFNGTNTILATKSGDNKVIISDFLSNALKAQPAQSDFLPKICQHVTNNIVNYKTGHLAFVIRMEGLPFDGVDDKHLFTQFVSLRNLLAGMGKTLGNRLAVWGTLQRQKIVL